MSRHDSTTIRELGYKSCIPYFILFDPDLNQQHLRLYTFIEQMESNPDPKINPTFSYRWFASILRIEVRAAMKIGKKMKDKGYITHTQLPNGKWVWGTTRKVIIDDTPIEEAPIEIPPDGEVSSEDMGGVSSQDTQNTKKIKLTVTKLPSSSFFFSETIDESLLSQKLDTDKRSSREFLEECQDHVDKCSDKKYPRLQRANALVKLLIKLKSSNTIFRPSIETEGEESHSSKKLVSDEDFQLVQEYLHAKKMEGWGQDINLFMKKEKRERAIDLLKTNNFSLSIQS
jgi:hypothetical protein